MLHNLKTKDMGTPLNKFYRYLLTHKIRIPLQKQFCQDDNHMTIISGVITNIFSFDICEFLLSFIVSDKGTNIIVMIQLYEYSNK